MYSWVRREAGEAALNCAKEVVMLTCLDQVRPIVSVLSIFLLAFRLIVCLHKRLLRPPKVITDADKGGVFISSSAHARSAPEVESLNGVSCGTSRRNRPALSWFTSRRPTSQKPGEGRACLPVFRLSQARRRWGFCGCTMFAPGEAPRRMRKTIRYSRSDWLGLSKSAAKTIKGRSWYNIPPLIDFAKENANWRRYQSFSDGQTSPPVIRMAPSWLVTPAHRDRAR